MNVFKGKNIVILGLAKSGTAVAKILYRLGAKVIVNDIKAEEECVEKQALEELGIQVICGEHPNDLIHSQVDLLVKNPGIPYTISPIRHAMRFHIPIVTEVEIAYMLAKAPIIAITGSNGKTTTTTLIGEILKQAGKGAIVAGNIGTVVSEKALDAKKDQILVTELSSFQLKGTKTFRPRLAILLNIYPAHLDYHQTFEDYLQAKANIFQNQTEEDFAVLNANCDVCLPLAKNIKSRIYLFSTTGPVERGAYIEEGMIYWKDGDERIAILPTADLFLKGAHLENVLASVIAGVLFAVDFPVIRRVLTHFKGVEHRLEFVLQTESGVTFYNDSKATNPTATITALTSFENPVILIAGGLDRGIQFDELIEPFKEHVKAIITYGQTAKKLIDTAEKAGIKSRYTVDNITDAVEKAYATAERGDIVLLSPACASWDMFSSFEERGRMFKEAVHKMK